MVERAPQPEVQLAAMEQQEQERQKGFQNIIDFIDKVRGKVLGQ
jgi:hypothetical protein